MGEDKEELGGSEYLKVVHNKVAGDAPMIDLAVEKKLQDTLLGLIKNNLIKSAHDISEGGIACALAECCIINEENMIGAEVNIPITSREDFALFSESQSRIIISIDENEKDKFETEINKTGVTFKLMGKTGGTELIINDLLKIDLVKLADSYYNTIPTIMSDEA